MLREKHWSERELFYLSYLKQDFSAKGFTGRWFYQSCLFLIQLLLKASKNLKCLPAHLKLRFFYLRSSEKQYFISDFYENFFVAKRQTFVITKQDAEQPK